MYVYNCLEFQLSIFGKVCVLVLKVCQFGVFIYVVVRYYYKVSMNKGINVYIIVYNQDFSVILFGIVVIFQKNNVLVFVIDIFNVKSLKFYVLNSFYVVGMVGQKVIGRGKVINLYYGLEVVFWINVQEYFLVFVQIVFDMFGIEIIFESMVNGVIGEFYNCWKEVEVYYGEYQVIFVFWFDLFEYFCFDLVIEDFKLFLEFGDFDISEVCYCEFYNFFMVQMVWRRVKLQELCYVWLFQQEYLVNVEEVFQNKGERGFIDFVLVMVVWNVKDVCLGGFVIMGIDFLGFGID